MKLSIEFLDGTSEPDRYVDDCGVQDGVLWVRPTRHGDEVDRYPVAAIRKWRTDR